MKQFDEANTTVLDASLALQKYLDEAATEKEKINVFKSGIKSRHARAVNGITVNTPDPKSPWGNASGKPSTAQPATGTTKEADKPSPWAPTIFKNATEDDKKPDGNLMGANDPVNRASSKVLQQRMQMAQASKTRT